MTQHSKSGLVRDAISFVANGFRQFRAARSRSETRLYVALWLAAIASALMFALIVLPLDSASVGPRENGIYEYTQAGILLVTAALLLAAAIRFRGEVFYFAAAATFLCALATTRETPSCNSAFYDGGFCLAGNTKTILALVSLGIVVALVAYKRVPFARSWSELTFFYAVPVILIVATLAFAAAAESYHYVWFEEIAEFAAYANIFGLALILHVRPRGFVASVLP